MVRFIVNFTFIRTCWPFRIVIVWGIILSINSSSMNYGSLVALRAFLGAFESVVTPRFVLLDYILWSTNLSCLVAVSFLWRLCGIRNLVGPNFTAKFQAIFWVLAEQTFRMGIWFSSLSLARAAGGLGSFAFLHYHGRVFKPWQVRTWSFPAHNFKGSHKF